MTAPIESCGDETVTLVRAAQAPDRYGTLRPDWSNTTSSEIRGCDVQPISTEEAGGAREYASTHVRLYAPGHPNIRATDRIIWRGETYEVDGAPAKWFDSGNPHHSEAELKRLAG